MSKTTWTTLPPTVSSTLAPLVLRYIGNLSALNRRPTGIRRYRDQIVAFCTFLGTDAGVDAITVDAIERYRLEMTVRDCCGATRRNALTAIRSFCQFLVRQGLLVSDPTAQIAWPRADDPEVEWLSDTQMHDLMANLRIPAGLTDNQSFQWMRNRRFIYLTYHAGLRISEAANLRWKDVDLGTRVLHVQRGKGGRSRALAINEVLFDEFTRVPDAQRVPHWPVAGTSNHTPLTAKSAAHIFERWVPRLGVMVRAHQLRRACATDLNNAQVPLTHIQQVLGHRDVKTTQRYIKRCTGDTAAALNKLSDKWRDVHKHPAKS